MPGNGGHITGGAPISFGINTFDTGIALVVDAYFNIEEDISLGLDLGYRFFGYSGDVDISGIGFLDSGDFSI